MNNMILVKRTAGVCYLLPSPLRDTVSRYKHVPIGVTVIEARPKQIQLILKHNVYCPLTSYSKYAPPT